MDSKDPILEDWKTCERFEWSDTCEWLRDLCALTLVLPSGLKPNLIFTGFRKVSKLSNFFFVPLYGYQCTIRLEGTMEGTSNRRPPRDGVRAATPRGENFLAWSTLLGIL